MVKSWRRRIGILAGVFLMGVSCVFPTVQVHAENEVETQANESVMVSYSTHVQKKGWVESVYNGESSGTTGSSLRLEGLKIQVSNIKNYSGNIILTCVTMQVDILLIPRSGKILFRSFLSLSGRKKIYPLHLKHSFLMLIVRLKTVALIITKQKSLKKIS